MLAVALSSNVRIFEALPLILSKKFTEFAVTQRHGLSQIM
jgi:hypothetical protein